MAISISTITELQLIGNDPGYPLDGNYELTGNVDASATSGWNGGSGFDPIGGDGSSPFTGTFDGKGFTISNLYINRDSDVELNSISLFTNIVSGTISNLKLDSATIINSAIDTWSSYTAGIVSSIYLTLITNCSVSNTAITTITAVAGICCNVEDSTVSKCFVDRGTIVGTVAGGCIGYVYADGVVENCYSTAIVNGDIATGAAGGFAISMNANPGHGTNNCYSSGPVYSLLVGGFIAEIVAGDVTSCYWDKQTSGTEISAGGTGKTTVEMKQQATFTGWDFVTPIWVITENVTYPLFSSGSPVPVPPVIPTGTATNRRYSVILTNKNPYPYAVQNDSLLSKVDVLKGRNLSYLKDIPIELWLNWNGTWTKYSDSVTGRYGSCIIHTATTSLITGISNCLGVAIATINDVTYVSNTIRYNFYQGFDYIDIIIDAHSGSQDRSLFDTFDGYDRSNFYNRMLKD